MNSAPSSLHVDPVGFYSRLGISAFTFEVKRKLSSNSFLVADEVYVASLPPKSSVNPNPQQHVFYSSAEDSEFQTFPDPRGNTLGRGTEVTLILKQDALSLLDTDRLRSLMYAAVIQFM